jgi:hypothetical protein
MTKNYNDAVNENEALVKAMLGKGDGDFDTHWKLAYLESFVANAMYEIPELKERVENRIMLQIKLHALSKKVA